MTEISHAIGLARILLIVGLVFLHYGSFPNSAATPFDGLDPHSHPFATWVNSAVLFFFFSAVPLLSMISGWLFFSFLAEDAWPSIRARIRRRFSSLYLPLVIWNAAYLAGLYALYLYNPGAGFFTSSQRISINFASSGPMDYINALSGVAGIPVAFQFWFVRDLFVTVLVTPLLWLALRGAPWLAAAAFCAIWLGGYTLGIFFRPDVPFFFYMGALIHHKRLALAVPLPAALSLMALYIALAGVRALAPYAIDFSGDFNPLWLDMATRAMRIPGVIACWGLIYRLARTRRGQYLASFGGLAFFLHSAHWPLLAVVKKAAERLLPVGESGGWMLAHYALSVFLTAAICISCGLLLARFFPRIFAFMNGGRYLEGSRSGRGKAQAAA